jgi:hypothetical protein
MSMAREWIVTTGRLTVAAATAVLAGVSAGAWLKVPTQHASSYEIGQIVADDPGREQWRQVVADLGGLGATFAIPMVLKAAPPSDDLEYFGPMDDELARLVSEVDAQLSEAEARYAAWREEDAYSRREAGRYAVEVEAEPVVRVYRYPGYTEYPAGPSYREPVRYARDAPPPEEFADDAEEDAFIDR